MEPASAAPTPPLAYNQIANRSLDRIGALSDGLFAIAMTLIVLEIRVPEPAGIATDGDLLQALLPLGPRFLTYLLSFLTLGIFWNGQQTQLSYFARGNRDLAWLSLLFLAIVALFPFTTSLLAEFVTFRLALTFYWLDIFLCGLALLVIWTYAERAGLVRDDVKPEVGRAIRRRILVAQALYGIGMGIGIVVGTLPAMIFIVLVQLNFAIAPRVWILHRI
jgi:TMEM175 potassium channel family protein